jgi:hypothetical protein
MYTASPTAKKSKLRETDRISKGLFNTIWSFYECYKKIYYLRVFSRLYREILSLKLSIFFSFFSVFSIFSVFEKSNIDIFKISIFIDYIDIPKQPRSSIVFTTFLSAGLTDNHLI